MPQPHLPALERRVCLGHWVEGPFSFKRNDFDGRSEEKTVLCYLENKNFGAASKKSASVHGVFGSKEDAEKVLAFPKFLTVEL